ncbi:hypothetical protein [Kribbella sp. CA-293567]|uniref:hypothetical protein n=1 Tax=Kribbella sp. CA-293567 TaxID=3002436 RepID=UPI0022DE7D8A|nr:hypothetical protein [Kribbella sp. CA-293567]WBQ07746.1 hypothetical protein OX958_13310 [Kribbella sp. CA-293567]
MIVKKTGAGARLYDQDDPSTTPSYLLLGWLQKLASEQERLLGGLVNEMEILRFTELEGKMSAAIKKIFSRLPSIIDHSSE